MADGSQFDDALTSGGYGSRGFRMENGRKSLQRRGGSVWGLDSAGAAVRFNILHCQGHPKSEIPRWTSTTNRYYWHNCYWLRLRNKVSRLLSKVGGNACNI
jgi:hypothetical protein